jgi:hypothetical protein
VNDNVSVVSRPRSSPRSPAPIPLDCPEGIAESLIPLGVLQADRRVSRHHRPSPPTDLSPAIPSLLARFFCALYSSMASGPFLVA